jgi:hypothetical protein
MAFGTNSILAPPDGSAPGASLSVDVPAKMPGPTDQGPGWGSPATPPMTMGGAQQVGTNQGYPVFTQQGEPGTNPSYQVINGQYYFTGDSGNGQQGSGVPAATGSSLDAAIAAWQQQQGSSPQSAATGTQQVLDPTQMASMAPLPYSSFGQVPYLAPATYSSTGYNASGYDASTYNPTGYGASGYNPNGYDAANFNASAYNPQNVNLGQNAYLDPQQNQQFLQQNMNLLQTEMAPTFQNQQRSLDESMAARGIFSSGAGVDASNQLKGQQDAALAGAQAPMVAQGYGYQQQDVANNANLNAQQGFQNAAYGNQAGQFNAGLQTQVAGQNAGAQNAARAFGAGAANTAGQFNSAAANTAAQYGAEAQNAGGQFNATSQNQAGQFNAGAANQAGAFGAAAANQAGATNAASANAMNEYNANNYLGITQSDQAAYNAWRQQLFSSGSQYGNSLLGSYLGSYGGPNAGAISTLGQMPGMAMNYGQTAYNSALANSGGLGNAFSNVFSGLVNNGAGGGYQSSYYSDPLNNQYNSDPYNNSGGG